MIAMTGPGAFQLELTIDDRITTPVDQDYMDLSMMKFDPDEHPITDISDPIGDNMLTSEK